MIYIFYPSNIMGGAEYLLIKTAKLLHNNNYDVGVIDFENGWVSKNINNEKIVKIYFDGNEKIKLEDDDFLITTSNHMYKLDNYFEKSDTRILFWTVQPYNIIVRFPNAFKRIPILRKLEINYLKYKEPVHKKNIESIIAKKSIVSMDGECDEILYKKYKLRYNSFLPIFINDSSFNNNPIKEKKADCVRILWLGRIDLEFKIHVLKKLLLDINNFSEKDKRSFSFDIIGIGPGLNELKLFIKDNISLKVSFLGEVASESLSAIITEYDIGFAMGTSALDIAAQKIPTILLDFSYSEIVQYSYRWIFETDAYTLGRDIDLLSDRDIKVMKSIKEVFFQLQTTRDSLSYKSFDYVYNNHSSETALQRLKLYMSFSELTLRDVYVYRLTKPFWNIIQSLVFSIRN